MGMMNMAKELFVEIQFGYREVHVWTTEPIEDITTYDDILYCSMLGELVGNGLKK